MDLKKKNESLATYLWVSCEITLLQLMDSNIFIRLILYLLKFNFTTFELYDNNNMTVGLCYDFSSDTALLASARLMYHVYNTEQFPNIVTSQRSSKVWAALGGMHGVFSTNKH